MAAVTVASPSDAATAIAWAGSHHKFRSWLVLHILELPALDGVGISPDEREYRGPVEAFAASHHLHSLLLRSDAERETGRYPRGGYTIDIARLDEEVLPLLERGRLVWLLEPRSPFNDLYSIGVNVWPREDLVIEAVGPGFDASDLKRGDATPHEQWRVSRRLIVTSHAVMDSSTYKQSWHRRFEKVRHMLGRAAGSTEAVARSAFTSDEARATLVSRNESLLLEAEDAYRPMPDRLLESVLATTLRLSDELPTRGFEGEPFSVSMSFYGVEAVPIWWDIVWPTRKYEGLRPGSRS